MEALFSLAAARRICSKLLTPQYLLHEAVTQEGGMPAAAAYSNSPISNFPEWVTVASSSDGKDDVTVERTNEFLTSDLLSVPMQAANSNYHNPV